MNKLKKRILQLSIAVITLINTVTMKVAQAIDFGFSVDSDGKVTVSGGEYPNLNGSSDVSGAMNGVLDKYKDVAKAVFAFCTVTAFLLMVWQFTKLAAAGDNEQARKKAIVGILTCGVAIMLLGGITIVISFFWTALGE